MARQLHAFGWIARLAALAALSCGGQSGNEGSLPAAPCAGGNTLAVGRIERLNGGCVTVRIERVVAPGEPELTAGTTITGRMGIVYAYRQEFENDDAVAVLVRAGSEVSLELFPLQGDQVQVQWGNRQLQVELDELAAADCVEQLEAKRESGTRLPSHAGGGPTSAAPADESTCTP